MFEAFKGRKCSRSKSHDGGRVDVCARVNVDVLENRRALHHRHALQRERWQRRRRHVQTRVARARLPARQPLRIALPVQAQIVTVRVDRRATRVNMNMNMIMNVVRVQQATTHRTRSLRVLREFTNDMKQAARGGGGIGGGVNAYHLNVCVRGRLDGTPERSGRQPVRVKRARAGERHEHFRLQSDRLLWLADGGRSARARRRVE